MPPAARDSQRGLAMNLSREQIDFMVDTMRESTLATQDELTREGL